MCPELSLISYECIKSTPEPSQCLCPDICAFTGHMRLPLNKFWDLSWAQEFLQLLPTVPIDHGSIEQGLSGPHWLSVDMKIKLPTGPCQMSQSHPMPGILFPYSSYSFHPLSPVPAEVAWGCRCCAQPGPWAPLPLWTGRERRRKGANAGVMFGACLDRRISAFQLQFPELLIASASLSVSHRSIAQKKGPFPFPCWEEKPL